ncbi:flagellar hook-basal body complex protein FliE [Tahibacter soli]|jgi:flagellar hook-basal body complex protein FliE|uniref:Flagellar hook-basal body complex protein FliE n=1 Tax=Tahibacter soli TaxID=2983605 RepID=A0A9X3YIG5_9GAMM|nr:flagellar hook-basal body complex protein FliE [Tahibacter soli]MDC8012862.1 flagellar hook-basal body complex protein FliE [Tahibacter soli]
MSDIGINAILAQIRALKGDAAGGVGTAAQTGAAPAGGTSFADTLARAATRVSDAQHQASDLARSFELGDRNVSLARVMIAQQEAQVGFKAAIEVRNRLVRAYQDVMNMPL